MATRKQWRETDWALDIVDEHRVRMLEGKLDVLAGSLIVAYVLIGVLFAYAILFASTGGGAL